jgi:pimeloyl-ACP methyl ester carboxylesterase
MAPIGRTLADAFHLLEPLQSGSADSEAGAEASAPALTVARHVADLHEVIAGCGASTPALVGSSWGAMLALAYAAAHPENSGPLVLIGCGTFDTVARARFKALIAERTTPDLRRRFADRPNDLLTAIYSYDPIGFDLEYLPFDLRANRETWADMLRLQADGTYPAAFARIKSRVLMLHGDVDPHPGAMIRDSLRPWIPQLEYKAWAHCGHYPWNEREVRDEFYSVLRGWLTGG